MREHHVPQFTVDGHRPVRAFDVLGVSFATGELGYTNLLTALDLVEHPAAGRPLACKDDDLGRAGRSGHSAFNPEPIADFIDAAVLGDGEQAVLAITGLIRDWKAEGRPGGRDGLLLRLAVHGGVYVPRFYDVTYRPDGGIDKVAPNRPGVPRSVAKHTVTDLDAWPYPAKPIVPVAETVHEAVQRGDFPWLYPWLPVLPGRHDHPAGPGTVDHHHRLDGRDRPAGQRVRRGRPAVPVERGPQ